jgi:asparagine synthase (glutamine-hydrolysing)
LPGIAGIVDSKQRLDLKQKIDNMLCSMKHESWYVVDQFHRSPIALGRAALGIIDRSPQPAFNQNKSLCLVMCGEIYDCPGGLATIRKRDDYPSSSGQAHLMLSLIEKHGIGAVKDVNGSFALALWNFPTETLTLVNDRYGLRPLYYFWKNDLFIFASEMKSILTCPDVGRKADIQALSEFLSLNAILGDKTLFAEIKTLSPASILTLKGGRLNKETYWTLDLKHPSGNFNKKEKLNQAHHLMKQAVKRQVDDDLSKALSLSGGLDSRTILGAIAELGYKIPTFTFGIEGCPDQKLAKDIANAVGMENRFFELSPDFLKKWAKPGVYSTEGMNNCVNFHGIEFVPEIRKKASVVINGFLGGELFGFVSMIQTQLLFEKRSGRWIERLFHRSNQPFSGSELTALFRKKHHQQTEGFSFESFRMAIQKSPFDSPFDKFYHFRFSVMAPKSFLYGLLLDNNLVEYRVPFADYDLVDFVSQLPPGQKALAAFHRRLLTEKFPPLGSIPYQRTGLPVSAGTSRIILKKLKENFFHRPVGKRRYSDYDEWMRRELKEFVSSTLLSENSLSRGFFEPDNVRSLVKQHMSGESNLSSHLGALLTFELWSQLFLDVT